jgi:Zn ribbon nucleic-acid-binding protein
MVRTLHHLLRPSRRRIRYFAVMRCPHCGELIREQMPSEGSVLHTKCFSCGLHIHKRTGICCVYCSDADVPCPQVQRMQGKVDRQ